MSDANKELARRLFDAINTGDEAVFAEVIAPDAVEHEVMPGTEGLGVAEALAVFVRTAHAAFSGFHMKVSHLIAEGDLVAARYVATGTHTGPFMGVEATGAAIDVAGFDLVRIADGKMVEHWGAMDSATLMAQLGVLPPLG